MFILSIFPHLLSICLCSPYPLKTSILYLLFSIYFCSLYTYLFPLSLPSSSATVYSIYSFLTQVISSSITQSISLPISHTISSSPLFFSQSRYDGRASLLSHQSLLLPLDLPASLDGHPAPHVCLCLPPDPPRGCLPLRCSPRVRPGPERQLEERQWTAGRQAARGHHPRHDLQERHGVSDERGCAMEGSVAFHTPASPFKYISSGRKGD